jgi:CheY-like chemotaxis protein
MGRVLVVDDDTAIRELLRAVLELEGYQVATADDGAQALEFLAATRDSWVVLMDVMMPKLGGIEVCGRLSAATDLAQRHRVALMTAGMLDEAACPALVRALLRKPFDVNDVVRLVGSLASDLLPAALTGRGDTAARGVEVTAA